MRCGLLKSIETKSRTPHGRNASATRASCGRKSGASTRGLALTLLIEQALMPTDAISRA